MHSLHTQKLGYTTPPPSKSDGTDRRKPARSDCARGSIADTEHLAENVLRAFNTWAFKREQPDHPDRMRGAIRKHVAAGEPIKFVMYWGKGPRARVAAPDLQCLDYLDSMRARIAAAHGPGASFQLIMTDTHARLNGHTEEAIESYFADVRSVASERGLADCRLSTLVANFKGDVENLETPSSEMLEKLINTASKWYRGGDDVAAGATHYFHMNMIEKRAVGEAFPDSIFISFNGGDFRVLLPNALPIFYMYSIKRGIAEKPWFLPRANTDAGVES